MAEVLQFSPQMLTGRSRGHIVELADPPCSLHHAVVEPFLRLRAAAREAGIDLVPISTFRDFDRQLAIWNGKHLGQREVRAADGSVVDALALDDDSRVETILLWSALPGASRHHWGTDMDVIDAAAMPAGYRPQLVTEEFMPGGVFERLEGWLARHAAAHGFFRPYTTWRGGVQPEPWHLSYAPVADQALAVFSPEVLREALDAAPVEARAAVDRVLPELFERYVRNIDTLQGVAATSATRPA